LTISVLWIVVKVMDWAER